MKKPMKRRPAAPGGKDTHTIVMQLALLLILIFRIPLGRLIGDKGIACFGTAAEIFAAVAGMLSFGLSEAVAIQVRYRVKRGQLQSSLRVLRSALAAGGVLGIVCALICVFFGYPLAEGVLHLPGAGMAIVFMGPAMFFCILSGVLKGYFQGNGSRMPAMHSQVLYTIFLYAGGLLGASLLHGYGGKVSALLQNEDFAGSYGAAGAALGILAASVFCFLHLLILCIIYRGNVKKQAAREQPRSMDTGLRILQSLAGTGAVYGLYWFCFHAVPLLDQVLFLGVGVRAPLAEGITLRQEMGRLAGEWGAYYGRCLTLVGIVSGVSGMVCLLPIRRIVTTLEREESRIAREKLGTWIHQCAAFAIPAAVFLAVLSENFLDVLFQGDNKQTALWVQLGSLIVVFSVFASVFTEVLLRNRKVKYVVFSGAIALAAHTGMAVFLCSVLKLGIMGIVISVMVFYGVVTVLGFFLVCRFFQYGQEWLRSFGITVVASALAGLAALLLNKLLRSLLGSLVTLIIALLAAVLIYLLLLVVTRAFRRDEMDEMPGGGILILLSELLHYT